MNRDFNSIENSAFISFFIIIYEPRSWLIAYNRQNATYLFLYLNFRILIGAYIYIYNPKISLTLLT